MSAERYLNLVFQGGGVRGIAYAGVLDSMPEYCKIHAVAGTSAGAIVAALLAIGVRGERLKTILESRDLFDLLEKEEADRTERLRVAWADAKRLWEGNIGGIGAWELWRFGRKHKKLFSDLQAVWLSRGLHRSGRIRQWLDRVLEGKTFDEIKVDDLKIVAADVSAQRYVIFDRQHHRGRPIAEAVHASISIPVFFTPFMNGPQHLVDGGLVSNFPSFLFAQGRYPTIGFRFADIVPPGPIDSSLAYLRGLILTMAEAHDRERGDPPYFRAYPIQTPKHIPSTKFALTREDVDELYELGRQVGRSVDWDHYSSPIPVVSYYDPKPHETLEFSLSQARRLWEAYADENLWVDALQHDAFFEVRIQRDWTTHYDRIGKMKVVGQKPLFVSRFLALAMPQSLGGQSFVELSYVCEEKTPEGNKDLIRVPAFTLENGKGFIFFYVPPLTEDQAAREFHTGFVVPQEFAKTVAMGSPDTVSYGTHQLAKDHRLRLTMRVLVDVDLPKLSFKTDFGKPVIERGTRYEDGCGRTYRVYECDVGEIPVMGNTRFPITITRNK